MHNVTALEEIPQMYQRIKLKFIVSLFLCLAFATSYDLNANIRSTDSTYSIIKSFDEDWLVYSKTYGAYLPLPASQIATKKMLFQLVDLGPYQKDILLIRLPPNTTIFMDKLLMETNSSDTFILKEYAIEKLLKTHSSNIFIGLCSPTHAVISTQLQIVSPVHVDNGKMLLAKRLKLGQIQPRVRENMAPKHHSVLVFILAIFLITLIVNVEAGFASAFFGFRNILSNNLIEDSQLLHISRIPLLIIVYLTGLLLAFLAQYSLSANTIFSKVQVPFLAATTPLSNILWLSVVLSLIIIIRYLILVVLSWFFNQQYLVKIHFFDTLKLLLKCLMVIGLLYFLADLTHYFSPQSLAATLIISLILTLIILLFKTIYIATKISHSRNVYLFSYLCISDILPTIFLITFLLR